VIVKMNAEKQRECRLAGETEVLGENLPQCHFCQSQNPMTRPEFEPGLPPELWRGLKLYFTHFLPRGSTYLLHIKNTALIHMVKD
jgi:hypothetical protein